MSAFNRNGGTKLDLPSGPDPAPVLEDATARRNPVLVLWDRRWLVVTSIILAVAGAFVYLGNAIPIYESHALVFIEQNNPRIIASDPTGSAAPAGNYLWTQCGLLRSSAILSMALNEPGIRDLSSFSPGADPLPQLRNMVSAVVGRRDDLITVAVRSRIKEDAPRVANAIVAAFTKYHDKNKRSSAHEVLDLLENQKKKLDVELNDKLQQKLEFQTKYSGFSFGHDKLNPAIDAMAKLSSQLTDTQLATLKAQAAYNTAKSLMDDPIKARQMLETRAFKSETAQLRGELRELQQRMASMGKTYLPGFPEYTAIQDSIKHLNDVMAEEDRKLIEAYMAELDAEVQSSKRSEDAIANLLSNQQEEVRQLNTVVAQYDKLQSDIDGIGRFAEEIYTRLRQLSLTEDANTMNVRMVEPALIESAPVSPNKSSTLFEALLLGSAIGAGLAFLRDWMDQRLRSAEEIKQVLGLPVLGVVPHISTARTPSERGMIIHNEAASDVAEAYRTIRTAIYFGERGGVAKTILVTSPTPGDGKTTLASNLAIAMAQAGNRVLLLDADFRKPTQHKIFAIDKRIGLSSVLAGEVKLDQAINATVVPGLDVLPCGPIPANPSEILNSQTFADILEQLAQRYDHVILDSAPIIPVTDSRILAASCDVTVLALRAERSTRKGALHSRDMLRSVGSHVMGVVVNDVRRRKGVYGYYYNYGEAYQYGYGQARRALASDASTGGNGAGHSPTTDPNSNKLPATVKKQA